MMKMAAIVAAVGIMITGCSVAENDGRGLVHHPDYPESIVDATYENVGDFLAADTNYDKVMDAEEMDSELLAELAAMDSASVSVNL